MKRQKEKLEGGEEGGCRGERGTGLSVDSKHINAKYALTVEYVV